MWRNRTVCKQGPCKLTILHTPLPTLPELFLATCVLCQGIFASASLSAPKPSCNNIVMYNCHCGGLGTQEESKDRPVGATSHPFMARSKYVCPVPRRACCCATALSQTTTAREWLTSWLTHPSPSSDHSLAKQPVLVLLLSCHSPAIFDAPRMPVSC